MSNGIERLLRESNPPSGQLASPVPQYLNPETGQPEVVRGRYGAPFSMLLGPDGHPINNSNRLPVADQASVDKLEQVRQLLESLESVGATAANQTAIVDVLNTRATEATLASAVTKLTDLLNRLDQSLNVQFAEPQEVTLTGQIPALYGADVSERPPADEVPVGQQFILVNENLDAWMSDGSNWVVI